MKKKYTAFISYAAPDEHLAKDIKAIFEFMGHGVYFAQIALREEAGETWRDEVIKGMEQSYSIIPIYTRNSIKRPWVLYELGVADALGLKKYPARVSEISPKETSLPGKDVQIFRLFNENDLIDLFTNACNLKNNPDNDELEKYRLRETVKNQIASREETKNIIRNSSDRWVFIAGSASNNFNGPDNSKFLNRVDKFLPLFVNELLDEGFSIASCPQVSEVGKIVCQQAISWITKNDQSKNRYRIAGIYPIDRDLRELDIAEDFKNMWRSHLLDFRKSYMASQEWLVVVGGNQGTMEEYLAGIEKNVKVCPIPCFEGAGLELWKKNEKLIVKPCAGCYPSNNICSHEMIKNIVQHLKNA